MSCSWVTDKNDSIKFVCINLIRSLSLKHTSNGNFILSQITANKNPIKNWCIEWKMIRSDEAYDAKTKWEKIIMREMNEIRGTISGQSFSI